MKIVTSSGDFLTVNSHKHSDLFWALRGGGGGTYGVVTSVTYRTYPSTAVTAIYIEANSTNARTFSKFFTEFVRIHTNLSDLGFGGYLSSSASYMNALYMAPNITQAQANKTIDPFFAFAQNLTSEGLNITVAFTVPYPSWYAWYEVLYSTGPPQVGFISEMASRLISRDTFENNPQGIAEAVLALNGAGWT